MLTCLQPRGGDESPIPLAPGERLIYESGWNTRKTVVGSAFGAAVLALYVGVNARLTLAASELALLTEPQLAGFGAVALVAGLMFAGTTRAAVRYAVLSADGLSVRLYPYAPAWIGAARPVTLPIKLLSIAPRTVEEGAGVTGAGAGRVGGRTDGTSVYVSVKGCASFLTFDKPARVMQWIGGPGTGLVTTARGVSGTVPESRAAAAAAAGGSDVFTGSGIVTPQMLYSLPSADREAVREYALLVHVLSGRTVDMPAVASGSWELGEMTSQLDQDAHPRKGPEGRVWELRNWRRAVDPASGTPYWWNTLSRHVQWSEPQVDGKGPYAWHPDLAAHEEGAPPGPAAAAAAAVATAAPPPVTHDAPPKPAN